MTAAGTATRAESITGLDPAPQALGLQDEKVTGHLQVLDSLRGFAIMGVLITHAAAITLQTATYSRALLAAKIGVELFYLVSAFTIFMSVDRRSNEKTPTTNFYLRRFFRIAPMFYICLVLNFIRLRFPFVHGYRASAAEYGLGFLFLFGFSPMLMLGLVVGGWSIAVETTFYVLVPLCKRLIRSLPVALIAFAACSLICNALSIYLCHKYAANVLLLEYFGVLWFPAQAPVFLLGIAVYYWWKKDRPRNHPVVAAVLLVLSVATYMLWHLMESSYFHQGDLPADTMFAAMFFVAFLLHPFPWLVNGFTRYLGKLSYSIYLLHIFAMELLPKVNAAILHQANSFLGLQYGTFASFATFLLVAGVLAVALAAVGWRWVEQPGIRLGRRLIAKREGRSVSAAALPPLRSANDTPDAQF